MKTSLLIKTAIVSACISICLCNMAPFIPYQNFGLCDRPTIPIGFFSDSTHTPDSTHVLAVTEIYDYEKRLINMTTSEFPYQMPLASFSIYWNGMDQFGKRVSSGKYTAKVSILSIDDTTCQCKDIFVAD